MATTQTMPSSGGTRPSDAWAGWVVFAAVILTLLGTLHAIQGFLALFDDGYFVARGAEQLVLIEYSAWGVVLLIWGLLQIAAGLGLAQGKSWARWFAIVVVFVDVILQIGFLPAYPIWSAILITLDVVVIFALTARWSEARAAM
jgi:uncharacterized membrane protein (DUF2068 family)